MRTSKIEKASRIGSSRTFWKRSTRCELSASITSRLVGLERLAARLTFLELARTQAVRVIRVDKAPELGLLMLDSSGPHVLPSPTAAPRARRREHEGGRNATTPRSQYLSSQQLFTVIYCVPVSRLNTWCLNTSSFGVSTLATFLLKVGSPLALIRGILEISPTVNQ